MRRGLFISFMMLQASLIMAQHSERMSRSAYFETYREIAIREMNRSGVPASITLAQGALESGDGNSRLARSANNHFGIKCHNDWNGKTIHEDDDSKNECFRKYASVDESYRDHSDYLRAKTRYAFLFDLKVTDYKGWARGLKKAGYATNPAYAESLIKIIEEYNLSIYDKMKADPEKEPPIKARNPESGRTVKREVLERNRVKYVLARKGDTFETLTGELGKLSWELPQYNDLKQDADSMANGQVIYIQPKRNKAEAGRDTHTVKQGESMYTISQLYAIKLERLYIMNNMNPGTRPAVGTVLQLRKNVKKSEVRAYHRTAPIREDLNDSEGEQIKVDIDL